MKFYTIILFISLLIFVTPALANPLTGKVIGITDGDTVKILTADKEAIKIRMNQIDAPESSQPFGNKSKQALSDLIFGKDVQIKSDGKDRYGRTLGTIFLDGRNINQTMVSNGAAWAYRQYSKDSTLLDLEKTARESKKGLWSLQEDQRMPPWEWRRIKKGLPPKIQTNMASKCPPQSCKMYQNCRDAKAALEKCGHTGIDGDLDGIPCEKLCL